MPRTFRAMKQLLDNKLVSGLALGVILVLAMGLRVWGADVGLPYDFVPNFQNWTLTSSRLKNPMIPVEKFEHYFHT